MNTDKLSFKQKILVAGTLFGMFFGAGNLIFPVHLGQMAGRNVIYAMIGFIVTAVGIPILGVAAIGITHSDGLQTLSSKDRARVRNLFHLYFISHNRAAFCDSEMRHGFLYDRRNPHARQ